MPEGQPDDKFSREALAFARSIIATAREPLVILDEGLRVHQANRSFYEFFAVRPEETEGWPIFELGNRQWDIPELRRLLEDILPGRSAFEDFEVDHEFERIGRRTMLLNARRLHQDGEKILLAIEDVSARRRAERVLDESRDRLTESNRFLSETLDALPSHVAVLDERGFILQVNEAWRRFAEENGLKDDYYAVGRNYLEACIPDGEGCIEDRAISDGIRAVIEGRAPGFTCEYPCHSPAERRWFVVRVNRFRGAGPVRVVVAHDPITERVLAERGLRESERRFRFLSELDEATRGLQQPGAVMETVSRMLGRHLQAFRCAYADVEDNGDRFTIRHDYHAVGSASTVGDYRLEHFGSLAVSLLGGGRTLVLRDIAAELPQDDGAAMFAAIGINAIVCCGLVKEGRLRAMMAVHQDSVREWSEDEVRLVEAVAERSWAYIERARADRELREQEARLRAIVEQAPAFICTLRGPGHVFELVNERYYELVGRREVVGKPVAEALPEVVGQGFIELLDGVYRSGESYSGIEMPVLVRRAPDGELERRFVNFVCQAMRGEDGGVAEIFVHGVDVTETVLARHAVVESEARLRQLADAMPQIVFAARPDGHVDYFNRRWYEYTGLPEDGRTGDESWEEVHEPGSLERVKAVWAEALRSGRDYEIEYRLRRADGAFRWHLGRALPIRDAEGRIVRWYGTNTDIDDQKRSEAAAAEARDQAQAANRMKDEFLATLSHELRTPLNAILGWAKILRSGPVDGEDLEEGLAAIERNSTAQAQIIEDLLDVSRIVSGNFKLEVQRVNIQEIVDAATGSVMPAATAKGIRVHKVLDSLAGPVSGDPARLQQVVWNLLSNAVKFTPKGGKVQVLLERVNSHVEISVIDTGMGIRPDFLPHVFDRFRQADSSTTRRHGGLGLGLAIVKQLVELHGGTVRAKSPGEGQGSTFTVTLPITVIHPDRPAPPKARPKPADDPAVLCRHCHLAGVRVLVLDDEPDARQLIRRVLAECEAEVALASSAAEALELVERFEPDVIVSDVGMPDQDGYEFIRQVRAKRDFKSLPAAALTAFARAEDCRQAMLAGFQTHVAKPVDPAELVAVVASLAGRTGTGP
jgi:PAS domain S-box-containing protein